MRGTEKQVTWALDIQGKAISALNWGILTFASKPAFVEKCKQIKTAIENVEYAGDLIAVYSTVNGTSDEENLKMISAIVGNRFGINYDNPEQYALIGKSGNR